MRTYVSIIVLALFGNVVVADDVLDESKAIEKIELLGGKAWRDKKQPGRPVVEVNLRNSDRFSEKYLHLLQAFPRMTTLDLLGTKIDRTELEELGEFKSLTKLWIDERQIDQESLRKLKELLPKIDVRIVREGGFGVASESVDPPLAMLVVGMLEGAERTPGDTIYFDADNVTEIDFEGTGVKDEDLKQLRKIKKLTVLKLVGTGISDDGLNYITDIKSLKTLSLARTKITDAGLTELSDLPKLTRLNLADTKITDEGMKRISKLTNLTSLNLRFTKVTNESVRELKRLAKLESLFIGESQITETGVQELKDAFPGLECDR